MSAWVSRERLVDEVDQRGKPKRKREKVGPGVKGVAANDRFVVQWIDTSGRLKQETIDLVGKPAKKLADRRAEQLTAQLTLGEYEDEKVAEWSNFRKEFERKWIVEKAAGTQRLYRESLDLFEEICKPKLMRSIRTETVANFRAGLRLREGTKSGAASPTTVNKHLRHLKAALRRAFKWDYLPKLPEVEMMREPEKEPQPMDEVHFGLIYEACKTAATDPVGRVYTAGEWWQSLLLTGMMTGMRIGEMLTVVWDDVHLVDDGDSYLVVRHYNAKGKRDDTIPLHPVVVEHLRRLKGFGAAQVFDWPMCHRTLLDQFHRIQRAAKINLPCHEQHDHTDTCHVYGFHSLKKACGTLNAARLPEAVLNAFMRHASPQTTHKFYRNKRRIVEGHVGSMYVPPVAQSKAGA